jgi:hypothetical protein
MRNIDDSITVVLLLDVSTTRFLLGAGETAIALHQPCCVVALIAMQ